MTSRLKFIRRRRGTNNKRVLKYIKYPIIPLSINDIYATTVVGDRLDLRWVIARANPDKIRRDGFHIKPGLQIRIPDPNRINTILRSFEKLNK